MRRELSATEKALEINLDESIYGTFAEIGAGQEVARHFFQAGKASQTIAKSISAYDMTFSDEIYGKESRYVCEARLKKMLDHEFSLLEERLREKRGKHSRFFVFADTVATASHGDKESARSHGWMGIRFQTRPGGPTNDIVLHVKLWDRFRLQQQEALGVLGVNLIHMAFFPSDRLEDRIAVLLDSLSTRRIEVNMIRFSGPDLSHLDNRLASLELVKQHLTEAVLFGANDVLHAGDFLFQKPVLVLRGTFRPVTNSHVEVLEKVLEQFKLHPLCQGVEPQVLMEITIKSLAEDGVHVDTDDFLHRVDTLLALQQNVMISNFRLFYQMKSFLRQNTDRAIGLVLGARLLPKMFDEQYYRELAGGILEGMGRLFDDKTRVFIYPHKDNKTCSTASIFHPEPKLDHLYQHLLKNEFLIDALQCDDINTSIRSSQVRALLAKGDQRWKELVPEQVKQLIESRHLFGYRT